MNKPISFENTSCMFFGKDGKCYEPVIRHKEIKNKCEEKICPLKGLVMENDLISKIREEIIEWRKVSRSKETPELLGDTFDHGWRSGINRVCNAIMDIMKD